MFKSQKPFPVLFFAIICLLSSLWSMKLDIELLIITLIIFLLNAWLIYRNLWKNVCKRNTDLLALIGVEKTDWDKKTISVGELDNILEKIDANRDILTCSQ